MSPKPTSRRLFFALWPDPATRTRLADKVDPALAGLTGRRVPVENWHLTLAFLGASGGDRQACVEAQAEGLRGMAFTLDFDQYGYWPRPQVVWLGASACPEALENLVREMGARLQVCGVETDHRPFVAHLTLLRNVQVRPRLPPSVALTWWVDSFALVESELSVGGAVYHVVRSWPLRA